MLILQTIILVLGFILVGNVLFWNDSLLFDGSKVAFTDTDNPCCCPECTPCQAETYSTTTSCTVDFSGSVTDVDCTSCSADLLTPTFELSKDALPALGDPCTYTLTGNLGCNSGGNGFYSLKFTWYVVDGINARAYLDLDYYCDGGSHSGNYQWQVNFTYSPTKKDCLATISMGYPTLYDTGCTVYTPCTLSSMSASVSFNT